MFTDSAVNNLRRLTISHPLIVFFTLAYAFSWVVFGLMIGFQLPVQFTILATLGPSIAALITQRASSGNYRAFRLWTGPRTLIAAAAGGALIIFAYVVLPGVTTADPRKLHWGILFSLGVYDYSTLLAGPLGEEPGWRGYALPRLETLFGPVRGSAVLALLWAGWHLPLFLVPGWSSAPPWIFALILIGLSMIMTLGANVSRFSVITAILMHAAFNCVSRFLTGLFAAVEPKAPVPFELVMAVCGLAGAAVVILATKGRLAYVELPTASVLPEID
ncbi:MAG: CPBP family intramembrane glutamic endopeptidase [Bryobacteraceae bacterium]